MSFLPALITDASAYLQWPTSFKGWLGLGVLLVVLGYLSWRWRMYQPWRGRRGWFILGGLLVFQVLATLFVGIRLPLGEALPAPGELTVSQGPALMVFAAVPWVLAAGFLGALASMVLAAVSGFLLALDAHTPFLILEYALLGLVVGAAVNQRYRTAAYQLLRHPIGISVLIIVFYPLFFIIDSMLATTGALPVVVDFVLTHVWSATIAVGGSVLVAGVVGEVIAIGFPKQWGSQAPLRPSPAEKSLETRSLYLMGPLVGVIVIVLTVSTWSISANAAQELLEDRMGSTAMLAAEGIPVMLEIGQIQIMQVASDPRLATASPRELEDMLSQQLHLSPYFRQLMILNTDAEVLADLPQFNVPETDLLPEEAVGVQLAQQGVRFQYYTIPAIEDGSAARLSFIVPILGEGNQAVRVLIGRSELSSNPYSASIIENLNSLSDVGGVGTLLDEAGRIIYHPSPNLVMTAYSSSTAENPSFLEEIGLDGTRKLVYFQPAIGRSWAVAISVSAQEVQGLALTIATPILTSLVLLSFFLLVFLRVILRVVTGSLRSLTGEAKRMAQGQRELDTPLQLGGVDEVGEMRQSFEHMRASLKARLDEQEQFLLVSRGVAATLEMETAVKPILQAASNMGASSARVVLASNAFPELEEGTPTRFGLGMVTETYRFLDDQLLNLSRQRAQIVLKNPARARLLDFQRGVAIPSVLMAFALQHENLYYGTLWVAFDSASAFSENEEDEIRFLTTLAGQAALAAANARLFLSAEIERQRLAAILASTPDPVLVTDHQNRLLLANPVAWRVLGDGIEPGRGMPITEIISQREVIDLLASPTDEYQSQEITLPNKRVYFATATSVLADRKRVGRVCVLRDVTHFKELDALKSEFVATVSHDLRSPLTLMRGYTTMLQMMGDLNDQQKEYVNKIITGVENMTRLVNNLLDLGRIEAGVGLSLEMVPVVDIVEQVISSLQLKATQKQIQMTAEYPAKTRPLVEADQALLQQAFYNLVENAIKYTQSGGKIDIRLEITSEEETILFQVTDTGIGIAPVDQPRLFERFFRAAGRESRKQKGTGLGLAIVRSIAERHHGMVDVESQLGKGSTFYMTIPFRQPSGDK